MAERKVVQFGHPIYQHKINYKNGDLKTNLPNVFIKGWNPKKGHCRKYIRTNAKYVESVLGENEYEIKEGSIDFWGEWEAESVARKLNYEHVNKHIDQYPEYIHYPFYTDWNKYGNTINLQNTDPFVFDRRFYYTCCKQRKTKNVGVGSIILFGSRPELPGIEVDGELKKQYYGKFLVDTVFVVKNIIECNKQKIEEYNNDENHMFYNCVLHKIHYGQGSQGSDGKHRIYEGATIDDGMEMFSFFPCKKSNEAGEHRLEIDLDLHSEVSTEMQNISYIIADGSEEEIKRFWNKLVKYTFDKGYYLGIQTEKPKYYADVEYIRENPEIVMVDK